MAVYLKRVEAPDPTTCEGCYFRDGNGHCKNPRSPFAGESDFWCYSQNGGEYIFRKATPEEIQRYKNHKAEKAVDIIRRS